MDSNCRRTLRVVKNVEGVLEKTSLVTIENLSIVLSVLRVKLVVFVATHVEIVLALLANNFAQFARNLYFKIFNKIQFLKQLLFKLKNQPNTEIICRGNKDGADKYIKKYALEFNLNYIEVPVAHTSRSLYSQLPDAYFNKPFSIRNYFIQQNIYIKQCDKFVIFGIDGDKIINNLLNV